MQLKVGEGSLATVCICAWRQEDSTRGRHYRRIGRKKPPTETQ